MMKVRVDPIRADVNAKLTKKKNPEPVSEDAEGDHRQSESKAWPGLTQQKIAGDQTGHDEDNG